MRIKQPKAARIVRTITKRHRQHPHTRFATLAVNANNVFRLRQNVHATRLHKTTHEWLSATWHDNNTCITTANVVGSQLHRAEFNVHEQHQYAIGVGGAGFALKFGNTEVAQHSLPCWFAAGVSCPQSHLAIASGVSTSGTAWVAHANPSSDTLALLARCAVPGRTRSPAAQLPLTGSLEPITRGYLLNLGWLAKISANTPAITVLDLAKHVVNIINSKA
jgi:hypothetical protein